MGMGIERNDVTDHPGWRYSPGVGDEEAVAAPVGHPAAGSVTLGIGLGLGVG
jgi:hypothetical protein